MLQKEKLLFVPKQIQYTQIQCRQNIELWNVKPVGASSNEYDLKG